MARSTAAKKRAGAVVPVPQAETAGQQLKRRRKALGFTQKSLADRWGVDEMTIYRWERDQCPSPQLFLDALTGMESEAARAAAEEGTK